MRTKVELKKFLYSYTFATLKDYPKSNSNLISFDLRRNLLKFNRQRKENDSQLQFLNK